MKKLLMWLLLCATFPIASYANQVQVVTTIKPVSLIVNDLVKGVATNQTLLPAGASPHDYALRPSDIRQLDNADLVIWVGPELEMFLSDLVSRKSHSVQLTAVDGLKLREFETHDHHDHDGHHHGTVDPHVWLGPAQAEVAANAIANALMDIDPANKQSYQQNLEDFTMRLQQANNDVKSMLEPVKGKGYFVFHDAYGYFEDFYGLSQAGHFTVSPDRRPGAKTLNKIRHALEDKKASCIFTEPQFSPRVVNSITQGMKIKISTLDPVASDYKGDYPGFIRNMGKQFAECLQ